MHSARHNVQEDLRARRRSWQPLCRTSLRRDCWLGCQLVLWDDSHIIHLIGLSQTCCYLISFFFGGGGFLASCFAFLPFIFISCSCMYVWTFPVRSPHKMTKHQKTSYDSKTGWAPSACVIRRSLTFVTAQFGFTSMGLFVCMFWYLSRQTKKASLRDGPWRWGTSRVLSLEEQGEFTRIGDFHKDAFWVHLVFSAKAPWILNLEGPTRKARQASVFSTHSDTQAVPAFHCVRMFKGIFSTRVFFKTHWHAVYQCLKKPPTFFDTLAVIKHLLMPLFLMGCFPVDFQEAKRPLGTKSVKRPIKAGKRPINEGKWPIKAMVLVGISVSCLMGCFRAPPPWWKTAPLKRPIKRSMRLASLRRAFRHARVLFLEARFRHLRFWKWPNLR